MICRRLPFPPTMLLLTHPLPSVHLKRRTSWLRAAVRCAHTEPSSFSRAPALTFSSCLSSKEKEMRHLKKLVFTKHLQSRHNPLILSPRFSRSTRLRLGPTSVSCNSPIYRPFIRGWCVDVYVRSSWPPLNPAPELQSDGKQLETKADGGEKQRKGEWEGRWEGGLEPLNHHWKLIRKLAGPGGDGRTDCALPSTILVMKWKRRGSVRGQISLH